MNGFSKVKNITSVFNFGEVIGEGSFGKVRLAVNRKTGDQFAIKIMRKINSPGKTCNTLVKNEIDILSNVDHPNIL